MRLKLDESRFLYTEIEEEGILFDLKTNEYLNLNSTLTRIFNYLKDGHGVNEIKEKLMGEFAVSEEECKKGILEGIELLKEKGWIYEDDC